MAISVFGAQKISYYFSDFSYFSYMWLSASIADRHLDSPMLIEPNANNTPLASLLKLQSSSR